MKWPEFEALFPGASPSTHAKIDWDTMRRIGPVMWTVKWRGQSVTMPDKPGVLADIAEALA